MAEELEFAELLRRHRLAAGLTQEVLAERAGLSLRGVSDLERGARRAPHRDTVLRLADALGLADAERQALLQFTRRGPLEGRAPQPWAIRTRLPVPISGFVGRERELAELLRVFATTRLLTLTGLGGIGKTRLALAMVDRLLETYADGAGFVELGSIEDAALVPRVVAGVLQMAEQPGRSLPDLLAQALHKRHLLLVLDNCEHVLATCADLAHALLRACPRLNILATSREPLGIEGEVVWRVPPLAVPPNAGKSSPVSLARHDSIRLFLERARAVQPDFALTEQNAPAVAEVCRHLEGIPLAIELAAARVRVLAPEQIVERLNDRLGLLAGSSRTVPARQHTLRAALDWSYDLLSPAERAMLNGLSVFAGGWTLEAAEAVVGAPSVDETGAVAVLDLLTQLVDKSLVLVEPGEPGEVRHHLLETVRQYAQERLTEHPDADALHDRHARFFLALAEQAEPELRGPAQVVWLRRLEREHDNLRAALRWSIGRADTTVGLRLAGALGEFWQRRGHFQEGREWLERAIEASGSVPGRACAVAKHAAGRLAYFQHDYLAARALLTASLAQYHNLDDRRGMAECLSALGSSELATGKLERAERLLDKSVALFRGLGDRRGVAASLYSLGNLMATRGDFERGAVLFEASLAAAREIGDEWLTAYAVHALGHLAWTRGDIEPAIAHLREALARSVELGDRRALAVCFESLALVAEGQQQAERAARLFGAAAELRASVGAHRRRWLEPTYQEGVARTRTALGEQLFEATWAAGREFSGADAVAQALAPEDPTT